MVMDGRRPSSGSREVWFDTGTGTVLRNHPDREVRLLRCTPLSLTFNIPRNKTTWLQVSSFVQLSLAISGQPTTLPHTISQLTIKMLRHSSRRQPSLSLP